MEINQDHIHSLNATSTISGVRKLSRYYTIMTLQSKTLETIFFKCTSYEEKTFHKGWFANIQ